MLINMFIERFPTYTILHIESQLHGQLVATLQLSYLLSKGGGGGGGGGMYEWGMYREGGGGGGGHQTL